MAQVRAAELQVLLEAGDRAAAVFVEATAVTRDGRISPADMGIWSDAHVEPLARIARFVEAHGAVAGIQLAITQPIRIEDAVIVEGEWGNIEEITSTYVVVRLWDWRRMVLPLSYFIEHPFQNWTRHDATLIGTVMLYVDYAAPVVQEAINRLSPQCRAAFTLRVFHEYSYKEVADHLGISVKTVEKHIARAMRETNGYLKIRYSATRSRHG